MINFLRKRWDSLKTVVASLKIVRFSIIVMLFGFIALTLVPQGQDIVVIVSSYGLLKKVWFVTAALLWAFQIWYWARVMLFMWFSSGPAMDEFTTKINEHAPRFLGAVSLLALAYTFFAAQKGSSLLMGFLFMVLQLYLLRLFTTDVNFLIWISSIPFRQDKIPGNPVLLTIFPKEPKLRY